MLVSSWFWIFILAFSGTILSFEHQLIEPDLNDGSLESDPNDGSLEPDPNDSSIEPDPNDGSLERTSVARSEREKRSMAMFLKGVAAIRTLLAGAKNVRSQSMTFKNYEKTGDFDTALKDFHKVVPPEATLYMKKRRGKQASKVWTGYVGYLAIHLKLPPSKRPTIEIIDEFAEWSNDIRRHSPNAGHQNDIKIIYK